MQTLDKLALIPIQSVWSWLVTSFQSMLGAPTSTEKIIQSLSSLIATCLIVPAASWFIVFKATSVTIKITTGAIDITASS